jgi:hypothetical protein
MPDQRNLTSPAPGTTPAGIITVDELWSEIGTPPTNAPNHEGWVTEAQLQGVIHRVVRQYESQAIEEIEGSQEPGAFAHKAEPTTLTVAQSTTNPNVGQAQVPSDRLPFLFDKVVDDQGREMHPDSAIHITADMTWLPVYRYQLSGRIIEVLPEDTTSITAYLIPTTSAVEMLLGTQVPAINQEIIASAKAMHERVTAVNRGIELEGRQETPET